MRILLLEDNPDIRETLSVMLEIGGHEVVSYSDGERALEALDTVAPDAVILDLIMPGIHGEQVLTRLRQDPRYAQLPVIIHTASHMKARTLDGATAVLFKPCAAEDLFAAIATVERQAAQLHAS